MSTVATPAVTAADSASATTPQTETRNDQGWTTAEIENWNRTGEIPTKSPSKSDSATDKKSPSSQDSAPAEKKDAVTASDSATDKDGKSHKKPENYGEKRFQELANENSELKRRLDAIERSRQTDTRDTKQTSQPAAEEPKAPPPLKQFLEKYFAEAGNKGKSYEEGVEAWQDARDKFKDQQTEQKLSQALAQDRQRQSQEAATKEMQTKFNDAASRYGKAEAEKIFPALGQILNDQQIPAAVKGMLNDSDVVIDLLYTLRSDETAFSEFLALARQNPGKAIRQIVTNEALVREQLAKTAGKSATTTPERGADGKFLKTEGTDGDKNKSDATPETKTRTPKPPAEVGGRGAAGDDPAVEAARSGNFSAFEAEQRRKARAAMER